jgi:hypothetical protein
MTTTTPMCEPPQPITLETMLPDLLGRHPRARAVLDQYGLKGCGGRLGPVESIGFFARTHGVDEARLLRELADAAAAAKSDPPPATRPPSVADTIYRRFFLAGIILILTAGATWGAWLLWSIGFTSSFTGISVHHVNAHGHAQIYGWVGVFIMGFAYQAFPRLWHTELAWPQAAVAAFVALVAGMIIRTTGMTATGAGEWALPAAMVGGALEAVAVLTFAVQLLVTYRRSDVSRRPMEPYAGFIFGAIAWFVLMCGFDLFHTWVTMTAATPELLVWYVATYQAPLRDLQIHGLALFMVLGVSIRMLPPLFGVPQTPPGRAWKALGVLTFAVLGQVVIYLAYRFSGNPRLGGLLMIPWLALAAGIAMVALPWELWRPLKQSDRSGKFVRMAYLWLAVSLVMLLMMPVYQWLSGIYFSHAYYGAIRHAITVGFISLMIMGFAAKVAPTLNGIDTRTLGSLWGPFILINVGCFLRCSLQIGTDWHPTFFRLVGVSGTLEVIALAWWGAHVAGILRQGKRRAAEEEQSLVETGGPAEITADSVVGNVLQRHPQTLEIFVQHGFDLLRQPVLRRTLARTVTIGQAAALKGVCSGELVTALRRSAGQAAALPVEHDHSQCRGSCDGGSGQGSFTAVRRPLQ